MAHKPHLRKLLKNNKLKRLDLVSLVGVVILALYFGLVEEDSPLTDSGGVNIFSGKPEIVDGDSIKIKGQRIRLAGIDAPEMRQYCQDADERRIPCGVFAKQHLEKLVQNRLVTCRWLERDRYNRILGDCQAGSDNLNRLMVENGWAFSYYSSAYDNEQKLARLYKRGMWVWKVQQPQQWRRENPR